MEKIGSIFYYLFQFWYYKVIFGKIGYKTRVFKPLKIEKPKNIFLGKRVHIGKFTWLAAYPHTGSTDCSLIIEDGSSIGHFNHIYATSKIHIGKKVLTADKVYISDNLHSYVDTNAAIIDQAIKQIQEVTIGTGSWLGENVCVIGANIGKGCVIGANTVVTKNIPDYCVVVGSPARIIKRYDLISDKWVKTTPDGEFLISEII